MKRKKEWIQKIIAWILLVVMGINCFGSSVPAGSVYATDYEKASEEAENEIRAAEEAAKKKAEEEQEMTDEETVKTEGSQDNAETTENTDVINHNSEEDSEESLDSKMEAADETQLYESMTVASDTTLTEDLEVGDLTVNSKLHLNGHKLTVHGDVELNSSLYIEEGYLVIKGDFKDTYYAEISMDSLNDCVEIEGDYVYAANYRYARTVKKGTIKIGGNIYGSDGNCCNKSIVFSEDCKVILCGDSEQNIDILTNSQLQIQNLVIDNTSEEGVLSEHILSSSEITDENGKLHYKAEGTFGETLTEDKVVDGDYCLLGGTLDLAGYSLTVKGNLLHAGGTILVNGGEMVVVGDYKKQLCYTENGTSVTDYSAGHLIMQNEQDYVLIHGDYFDSGAITSEGELTAGVLELKGSMLADDDLKHTLFYAKEKHQVKLTGEGQQIIRNGASYSGDSIRFAHLYIEQPESGSVVLESDVIVTGSVNHVSNNITGVTCLNGAEIVGDSLYGDVKIASDYSFEADVTLHGNAYWGAEDKKISINNCHVTVTGNLNDTGLTPVFTGEQALLTVTGDYILERYSYTTFESGIIQIGGDLKKNGDASISFGENAELQFIGKSVQTVSASHSNTLLTNVVVDNPEGVVVEDNIAVMNVSCKQGVLSYASGAVHGFTLEEDGEYEGDLVIGGGVLDLNGHNYHVKGNLTIANGALNMTNAADYLIVDGDFTTSSTIDHSPKLTAGTMEVNFIGKRN